MVSLMIKSKTEQGGKFMKNKLNKYFIVISILVICLAITQYALNDTKSTNSFSSGNEKAWVSEIKEYDSSLESYTYKATSLQSKVSTEKLIDDSLLIVKGNLKDIIGVYDYSLVIEDGSIITVTRCLYDFDLIDVLKGNDSEIKNVKISIPESYASLKTNKEYVFCLYKAYNDYDGAYCLTGGTYQGSFSINNSTINSINNSINDGIITNNTNDEYTLDEFKNLIDDVLSRLMFIFKRI